MHNSATFVGTKRLVGVAPGRVAAAERFEVDGKGAWMIFENDKPVGVEPSWDAASHRLRESGYRVRAEVRASVEHQRLETIKAGLRSRKIRK